jgi:glycosyltransferase involved in cell wall biosynthesis
MGEHAAVIWLLGLLVALAGTLLYCLRLAHYAQRAPRLELATANESPAWVEPVRLAVVIPAYNEAATLRDCLTATLAAHSDQDPSPPIAMQVWLVDDQSTDETWAIAQTLQTELADPRLHLLLGAPRPTGETWMGKNWACTQAVAHAMAHDPFDYLLFLDADVQLQPGAISAALAVAQQDQTDLLTLWPTIVCGCWGEWLAQPLIVGSIAAGLDFAEVNDPTSEKVFAVGPFMLFRRSAYEQIGGHRAVADQVVEDVELARKIKQQGLKLHYMLGPHIARLRMYLTSAALWEGWTKNWYLGSQRNLPLTLYSAGVVFWVCGLPLFGLIHEGVQAALGSWLPMDWAGLAIACGAIGLQYPLRRQIQKFSGIPPRYWWLTSLGGLFLVAIILGSIIKTETGWGWTWRGRPLSKPT